LDFWKAMKGVDAVVMAVRHKHYQLFDPDCIIKRSVVCVQLATASLPDDNRIHRFFELGFEMKGMGQGHIQRIERSVRKNK